MEAASPTEAGADPYVRPSLSLVQRAWAVFARPNAAWDGLETHIQWWFPLLVVTLVSAAVAAILHDRAVIPMLSQAWQEQVSNGQMPADQAAHLEEFFRSPQGLLIGVAQQCVVLPVIQFATALIVWFGVGFILGRPFGYRLALEVTTWAGLVTIPAQVLTAVLAWSRETLRGIHVGFGILLPDTETPSRLAVWLGAVLDALGPLAVWYVVVMILGASALSGAPRKGVAWVLGSLYLVLVVFVAALGAMFSRS